MTRSPRPAASATVLVLALAAPPPAVAASVTPPFEFGSRGTYATLPLPPHTRDVELLAQRAGSCRFGRTWGFDPARLELWADQGCVGTFRALIEPPPAPAPAGVPQAGGTGDSAGAAVAAAAAIAGIAILAHKNRPNNPPVYPDGPYAPPGYYPAPGYPAAPAGGSIQGLGGLCLDVRGGVPVRPGHQAMVWHCAGTGTQAFAWTRRGELRVGGLCLDASNGNGGNGAAAFAWQCNGSANQQWAFDRGTIRSRLNGRCLDVQHGRARPGTPVTMWDCHGHANQLWRG
jgi:hypothetical protein